MTWSIVARDSATRAFGIAVATRFFAVGALCPYGEGGVDALASQALINPTYGAHGLRLLRDGASAQHVVDLLTAADPGRAARQLHVHDTRGGSAAYTGAECVGWCGHSIHDGFSVAGNMLAGAEVVAETAREIYTTEEYPALDLRVDDHADPLAELTRLEAVSRERFVHFARFLPTRQAPGGVWDRTVIEAEIARATARSADG